jgi:hypothetical protein
MGNAAAHDGLKKRAGGGTWTVQAGDTLSRIASRRYGNAALWEAIRDSNPDRVKDGGRLIFVGTELAIPEVDVPDTAAAATAGASASTATSASPSTAASASPATSGPTTGGPASSGPAVAPAAPTTAGTAATTAALAPTGELPAQLPELRTAAFGTFSIYPDAFEGPLPRSHDGVQVVRQARFLALEAEAATAEVNPDIEALTEGECFATPVTVVIAGEQVRVSSKAEAQHTAQLLKEMKEDYGVIVDSQAGVDAIKARYTNVPASELDKLTTKAWEYKELLALHDALAHFAPVLGAARDGSSHAGADTEVKTVSKVDHAISADKVTGKLDNSTLGEYFEASDNLSVFTAGTDASGDFADNQTQLEGTAIHELAHGVLAAEVVPYSQATGFWADVEHWQPDVTDAEWPITEYGRKNAAEDLSEATMYYFTEPDTLSSTCPIRYTFIDRVVASWSAAPQKAP